MLRWRACANRSGSWPSPRCHHRYGAHLPPALTSCIALHDSAYALVFPYTGTQPCTQRKRQDVYALCMHYMHALLMHTSPSYASTRCTCSCIHVCITCTQRMDAYATRWASNTLCCSAVCGVAPCGSRSSLCGSVHNTCAEQQHYVCCVLYPSILLSTYLSSIPSYTLYVGEGKRRTTSRTS